MGLYCLGVRFYDPSLGNFLQEDPVLGSLSEPLTLNRWVYCAHDPINRMDKTGRFFGLHIILGGVTGFVISTAAYVIEVALTEKEWNTEEFLGEALIGLAVGAVTAATFGLASASTIAKIGVKVLPKISKALPKVGQALSKIGKSVQNIGSTISKFAAKHPLNRFAINAARGSIAGGTGNTFGTLAHGQSSFDDIMKSFGIGAVGGGLGSGFGGELGSRFGHHFNRISNYMNQKLASYGMSGGYWGTITGELLISKWSSAAISRLFKDALPFYVDDNTYALTA